MSVTAIPLAPLRGLADALRVAARLRDASIARRMASLSDDLHRLAGPDARTPVPALPLLQALADTAAAAPQRITVDCDQAFTLLPRELATAGLIVSEALDNALAHAFPGDRDGQVWIRLAQDGPRRRLTIRDTGVGIGDLPAHDAGGAALIADLAHSMNGYARLGSAPFGGGVVTALWPKPALVT